ncbi:hypothetical protein BXZ70DRAFT_1011333 [Cristinia sonorae]|uniref:Uncharacterized protein n=1 Tax=Cristinia sonorae TaxID=1940300 RepID=A0A8K0UGI2_9AGAR|nr:hypothetical protein BXZ70DRAFT_1011333 [Cristinia sonorae]
MEPPAHALRALANEAAAERANVDGDAARLILEPGEADGEDLGGLFNFAAPIHLQADDPVTQLDISNSAAAAIVEDDPSLAEFRSLPTVPLRLSLLKRYHAANAEHAAVKTLFSKHRVYVDSRYTIDSANPHLLWGTSHFLDYTLAVPTDIGLHACLPPSSDPQWCLRFRLNRPNIELVVDDGALPFDRTDACLRVAEVANSTLFLVMVENGLVSDSCHLLPPPPPLSASASTKVSSRDRLVFIAMLCAMLAHARIDNYYCTGYPDITDWQSLKLSTNVLNHDIVELNYQQAVKLHDTLQAHYHRWIDRAPDSYKSGVFSDRSPFFVNLRYGQNVSIDVSSDQQRVAQEAESWRRMVQFDKLAVFNLAIATHFTVSKVTRWLPRPPAVVTALHPGAQLYTAPRTNPQREVVPDLSEYPALDADGNPNHVYLEDGTRVARFSAEYDPAPCGVLHDLTRVGDLYTRSDLDNAVYDSDAVAQHVRDVNNRTVPHYLYPHGFTRRYGQVQAKGVPPLIGDAVRRLNSSVAMHRPGDQQSDDSNSDEEEDRYRRSRLHVAVEAVRSQGYNAIAHRFRSSNGGRIAQRGELTATALGSFAQKPSEKRTAAMLGLHFVKQMPIGVVLFMRY